MTTRRTFWFFLAAALVAVLAIGLLRRHAPQSAAAQSAVAQAPATLEFLPGDIVTVRRQSLRHTLSLTGSLRALDQATVKSRVAGEVRDVLVREGEAVKEGQVLARMDTREYDARVEQARGALEAARGQLTIATKARDNNQALMARGFISRNAFDNASSQYEIARANVESAQAALDLQKKSLNDTVIRAPITGVISSRSVQPGERVPVDARLFDIVDLRKMEMEAGVPAGEIASVSVGQDVLTRIEGLAEPVPGKVVRINPATQAGSRAILVYVQLENPEAKLRAGMFGEGSLILQKKEGVLTVPQSAVQTDGGKTSVYAIVDGKIAQRAVTLGLRGMDEQGPAFEVLTGLAEGMQVVRTNLGNLPIGAAARFMQARE